MKNFQAFLIVLVVLYKKHKVIRDMNKLLQMNLTTLFNFIGNQNFFFIFSNIGKVHIAHM